MMALVYDAVWRVIHVVLQLQRAAVAWLRARSLRRTGLLLWRRAAAAILIPLVRGFTGSGTRAARRPRLCSDGKVLDKVPQHVGLLITEDEQYYPDLANVVVWCMTLGISYISIYDQHGVFRRNDSRLLEEIMKQKTEFLSSGSRFEFLNGAADSEVLPYQTVVKVLSPDDGRLGIVRAAQRLCETIERRERTPDDITVSTLDSVLRDSEFLPDPELVLKFGAVDSTLGFLPWHIRLSEFISLPSHKDVSYEDLMSALRCYAACEQRLGK